MTEYVITETGQFSALTLYGGDRVTTNDVSIAEKWAIGQSGTSGHQISLDHVSLNGATDYNLDFTGRSYLTISNLVVNGATVRNIWSDSTASGLVLNNITSIGGVTGIWIRSKSNSQYSNINASGMTGAGFRLTNAASNVTLENITTVGGSSSYGSIDIESIVGLSFNHLGATDALSIGVYIGSCSGIVSGSYLSSVDSYNATYPGVYFKDNTFSSGTISNITVTGSYSNGLGLDANNIPNVIFSDIISTGNTTSGIDSNGSSTTFRDFVSSSNSWSGFSARGTSGANVVRNGVVQNNLWDGLASAGASVINADNIIISGNGTVGQINSGDGFTSHDTSTGNSLVRSVIYNNKNTALAVIGTSSGIFNNNTCVDNHVATMVRGSLWFANSSNSPGWSCKNNIVVNNTSMTGDAWGGILVMIYSGGVVPVLDYNCYWSTTNPTPFWVYNGGNAADPSGYNKYTFEQWKTYSGQDTHSIFADPLFVDSALHDYRLQKTSPCIATGTDVGLREDAYGNHIYGLPNIGATERVPVAPVISDNFFIGSDGTTAMEGQLRDPRVTS